MSITYFDWYIPTMWEAAGIGVLVMGFCLVMALWETRND